MTLSSVFSLRFVRYLIFGGFNTVVTYALFLWMASYIHFELAYLIAYIAGIVTSYLMNSYLVFNRSASGYTASMFLLIYAAQYLYGSAVLWVLVGMAGMEKHVAAAFLIASSAILTYFVLRILFRRSDRSPQAEDRTGISIKDAGSAVAGPESDSRI